MELSVDLRPDQKRLLWGAVNNDADQKIVDAAVDRVLQRAQAEINESVEDIFSAVSNKDWKDAKHWQKVSALARIISENQA